VRLVALKGGHQLRIYDSLDLSVKTEF
jgi:hypothetical protein